MAIKIGLTGGIGSGKSVVAHLLETMRIPVYISDAESKKLTAENEEIKRELIGILGEELYKNGSLNKSLLASYIFSDPKHAQQVNQIIHPYVRLDFERWASKYICCEFVALESAILIEAGFNNEVDTIVMVYAPEELRLQRVVERDSSPIELIRKRMQCQMSDEEKMEYADYIIYNDGVNPLIPQLEMIFMELRSKIQS